MTQLNKLQIKAEILTILSKLQSNLEGSDVDDLLSTLAKQEDKKNILDILIKELIKANEQKSISICFLLLKLCEQSEVEESFWSILKNKNVSDATKSIVLNILKDFGNRVDYEKLEEYFENPETVVDEDTKKLLQVAIINPEAQIDFLDFLSSLSDVDKKVLIQSLGEDYSSDNLANILNPLVLFTPDSEIGQIAIDILGSTKSQLALYTLEEALDFVDDEVTIALIKRNISKLKISGVRDENAEEFYKNLLSSKPYESYTSYPDGHGNQAVIFSREREDESIQMVALVLNDTFGLLDCFGFNDIPKFEFERIVNKFYGSDSRVYLNPNVVKKMLINAEKLTRKNSAQISYEYLCWKTLLVDIEEEKLPIDMILNSSLEKIELTASNLEEIFMMDFVQKWFLDVEYSEEFSQFVSILNDFIIKDDFTFRLESLVKDNYSKIISEKCKQIFVNRVLVSAYLKYLSGAKKESAELFALYLDKEKMDDLVVNVVRKSVYEYYVGIKFKLKEENKLSNIFAMRNKQRTTALTLKQVEGMIELIEGLWVNE